MLLPVVIPDTTPDKPKRRLTETQWKVAALVAQGASDADIGRALGLARQTIRFHRLSEHVAEQTEKFKTDTETRLASLIMSRRVAQEEAAILAIKKLQEALEATDPITGAPVWKDAVVPAAKALLDAVKAGVNVPIGAVATAGAIIEIHTNLPESALRLREAEEREIIDADFTEVTPTSD